jgi:hypothetical protein
MSEPIAALVPFQRLQPSVSRHQNVNSAASRHRPACHFGGKYAQNAKFANLVHFAHFAFALLFRCMERGDLIGV